MASQNLKRDSFGCLGARLLYLHQQSLLHDVQITTLDKPSKVYQGHKVVLAAVSQKIYTATSKSENLVKLKVSDDSLKLFLQLVYEGQVEVPLNFREQFSDDLRYLNIANKLGADVAEFASQEDFLDYVPSRPVRALTTFEERAKLLSPPRLTTASCSYLGQPDPKNLNLMYRRRSPALVGPNLNAPPTFSGNNIVPTAQPDYSEVNMDRVWDRPQRQLESFVDKGHWNQTNQSFERSFHDGNLIREPVVPREVDAGQSEGLGSYLTNNETVCIQSNLFGSEGADRYSGQQHLRQNILPIRSVASRTASSERTDRRSPVQSLDQQDSSPDTNPEVDRSSDFESRCLASVDTTIPPPRIGFGLLTRTVRTASEAGQSSSSNAAHKSSSELNQLFSSPDLNPSPSSLSAQNLRNLPPVIVHNSRNEARSNLSRLSSNATRSESIFEEQQPEVAAAHILTGSAQVVSNQDSSQIGEKNKIKSEKDVLDFTPKPREGYVFVPADSPQQQHQQHRPQQQPKREPQSVDSSEPGCKRLKIQSESDSLKMVIIDNRAERSTESELRARYFRFSFEKIEFFDHNKFARILFWEIKEKLRFEREISTSETNRLLRASDFQSSRNESGSFVLRVENIPEGLSQAVLRLALKQNLVKDFIKVEMVEKGHALVHFALGSQAEHAEKRLSNWQLEDRRLKVVKLF